MTPSRIWLPLARMHVARAGVGLAAVFGLLGQFITFYPGAEAGWFGLAAAMALTGLPSPTRQLRLVAVVLAVVLAGFAWGGYVRGRQYREWLSQQPKLLGSLSCPGNFLFIWITYPRGKDRKIGDFLSHPGDFPGQVVTFLAY